MYCCQPDELLSREELIDNMRAANKGRGQVNISIVEEQLKQDRERLFLHKQKWKRRWTLTCCSCCLFIMVGSLVSVIFLALGPWTALCGIDIPDVDPCGWAPRKHFGAVFTREGRIVMAGGVGIPEGANEERNLDDVWTSRDGKLWQKLVDQAQFGPRHGHAFVTDRNSGDLFIIAGDAGGTNGQANLPLRDVWRSSDGRDWTQMTAMAPWPSRKWHGASVDENGHIYIAGGLTGSGTGAADTGGVNDIWKSEDSGATWTPVTLASSWTARHSFAFARVHSGTVAGRFYILGGYDGRRQHDVWKSDDNGNTWSLMTFTHWRESRENVFEDRAPWEPNSEMSATVDNDGVLTLLGGGHGDGDDDLSNEVWTLPSPEEPYEEQLFQVESEIDRDWRPLKWSKEDIPAWTGRRGHAAFIDDEGTPFVLGGEDKDGFIADMWAKRLAITTANLVAAYNRAMDMVGMA